MMIKYNFITFILSHGRANNVKTLDTLNKCNYTGEWMIVCDDEDKTIEEYKKNFGAEHIYVFDKLKKAHEFDTCDLLSRDRKAIVYARNVCFDIAKELGYDYFLELDDDYTEFRMRYDKDGVFSSIYLLDFDSVANEMIEFLDTTNALSVAFAQTGDFIGGMGSRVYKERLTRKCMNSFFCKTSRPFTFVGRINEDVNTYVWRASRGELMFTIADMSLNQADSQTNEGGMTNLYLDVGTYIKSIYSVIVNPSSVKISEMGCNHRRIHHLVDWEHCAPKIISERFKK